MFFLFLCRHELLLIFYLLVYVKCLVECFCVCVCVNVLYNLYLSETVYSIFCDVSLIITWN